VQCPSHVIPVSRATSSRRTRASASSTSTGRSTALLAFPSLHPHIQPARNYRARSQPVSYRCLRWELLSSLNESNHSLRPILHAKRPANNNDDQGFLLAHWHLSALRTLLPTYLPSPLPKTFSMKPPVGPPAICSSSHCCRGLYALPLSFAKFPGCATRMRMIPKR
jgi:hypothetical protein